MNTLFILNALFFILNVGIFAVTRSPISAFASGISLIGMLMCFRD